MKRNQEVRIGDFVFCNGRMCFVKKILHGKVTELTTHTFSYVNTDEIPIIYFKPTPVIADMYLNHQSNLIEIRGHQQFDKIQHCINMGQIETKLEELWTNRCLAIGDDVKSYQASVAYSLLIAEVITCIESIIALREKSVCQGVQIFK